MCVCRVLRCVSLTLPQHQVNIRMAQCLCLHVTPQVTGWPLQHDSDYVCTSCMLLTDGTVLVSACHSSSDWLAPSAMILITSVLPACC